MNIGIDRCVEFINQANIGYLLISGGGEPFFNFKNLLRLIEEVNVKDIVIVSNGYWAKDYNNGLKLLKEIEFLQKKYNKNITIRISVDRWHIEKLGIKHVENIIELFYSNFNSNNFLLKIHTIIGDKSLFEILKKSHRIYSVIKNECSLDRLVLIKSNRKRIFIRFNNGYELEVEFAKLFNPNLEINLIEDISMQVRVFYEDLRKSQMGNFSTVINKDGTKGLDFLIYYNGNVSTWANYQINNIPSLYKDTYSQIVNKICNDVVSYSFLNETIENIIDIVSCVNETAVKRAIGINVRDYFGMYLLYENKTLLYYYIIILKKYIAEEIINESLIPNEIQEVLKLNKSSIIQLYKESKYTIINQYKEKKFDKNEWEDLFFLIVNKHFELDDLQLKEAVDYYNKSSGENKKSYLDIIKTNDRSRYERLLKRFNI